MSSQDRRNSRARSRRARLRGNEGGTRCVRRAGRPSGPFPDSANPHGRSRYQMSADRLGKPASRSRVNRVPSSEGSSWTLSWKPAIVPSRLMTSAVINRAPSTTRSVPRTTATFAFAAAARNGGPGAFEERRVGRRHRLPQSPVAGNEAFRKADDAGALDGRLSDGLFGQRDRLLGSRREPDVGECDSKHVPLVITLHSASAFHRRADWAGASKYSIQLVIISSSLLSPQRMAWAGSGLAGLLGLLS